MKLLHAADLHLGTPFTGRPEEEVRFLKKALLSVPEKIARLCAGNHCDLLLLSGDLFDGEADQDSIDALKKALGEVGVPVFISPGNHDFCGQESPYLREKWPENVHIFTKPAMESVALPELDCRVYGAGFTAMDCGPLLEGFRAEGTESWQIGVLHGDPLQKNSPYCPIGQAQVAASGLHYLALGHVHKAGQFVAGDTLCGWPGCPMGRGNDETGEKGVYLVSVGETTTAAFLPLDTPRFYNLEAEVLTTAEDALASILPPVGNESFYRITFVGECEAFDVETLSFPEFPHLTLRDRTVPPADLWGCVGEDSLEGVYFKMLHEALESADEETVLLAAKISRRILDGREVVLP